MWVGVQSLVLREVAMEEKANEITAIPALLETLEVGGDTIMIYAMECQGEIAEKIHSSIMPIPGPSRLSWTSEPPPPSPSWNSISNEVAAR
jgi:hypothetical protein